MRVPESITDRLPALAVLEEDWEPVSKIALWAWVLFYAVVLLGAAGGGGIARWFDLVFVPIHEGGHLLFSWSGSHWLTVAGGTLLQEFVPLALAVYFAFRRQIPGTAFCSFFFFEQFLPVGIYMADARSQSLTYVTVGDPDRAEHDWYYLFSHASLLDHDVQIGGTVKILGWVGMLAVLGWLIWRAWPRKKPAPTVVDPPPVAPPRRTVLFGDLGGNLETAARSSFWQWFHLEQTLDLGGVRRFQPSGPQFRSLCYLDVTVSPKSEIQALTLSVERAFIGGEDEPFARDLVRSFLCAVFPEERSEDVGRLVDEIGAEFGGLRPVIVAEGAHRSPKDLKPSPAYLVFIGKGQHCPLDSGEFKIDLENVLEGSTEWFQIRLRPSGS